MEYTMKPAGLEIYTDFIDEKTEQDLISDINKEKWDYSLPRRTQHYGYRYDYQYRSLDTADPIPKWTKIITDKMIEQKLIETVPDQIIINEYIPGRGIGSHIDKTDIFDDTIISLSLGSNCMFIFTKSDAEYPIYLLRRTLVIMKGDSRYKWKHKIPDRKTDYYKTDGRLQRINRQLRISITFRYVKN